MAVEHQVDGAAWPGIPSFESCSATFSHGHEPGVISAITSLPPAGAASFGDFTFSDGQRTVTIRDCKLASVQTSSNESGYTYIYHFLDRRWRWRFGEVSAHFNARDRRDNLIPWMAKTPREMAEYLLDRMGERNYILDLPDGVSQAELDTTRNNPAPGEKTPETRTNPEVFWDGDNPAVALDRLCQQFNRRLMLDPARNIVVIARPGFGPALPVNDYLHTVEQSVEAFATPGGVGILGGYVRVQMKLKLIAVGEEWDGRFLPIDELSYAPSRAKSKGKWQYTFTVTGGQTGQISMTVGEITIVGGTGVGASSTASGFQSVADATAGIAAAASVTASASGTTVTVVIEEVRDGQGLQYDFAATVNGSAASLTFTKLRASCASPWDLSDPNSFADVTATERLSYKAAQALALKSVFRYYRVADDDVSSGWEKIGAFDKIIVPGYGTIERREQLILQDTLVEQIIPEARDEDRTTRDNAQFLTENPDYYDGYSRDRRAVVYGSVAVECNGDWFSRNHSRNTPADKRIAAAFSIDPLNQLVIFGNAMYRVVTNGRYMEQRQPARLVLETSVLVKDEKSHAPIRYRRWIEFAKQTPGKDFETAPGETVKVDLRDYELSDGQPKPVEIRNPKDNHGKLRAGDNTVGIEWFSHADVPYAIIGVYAFATGKETYRLVRTDSEEDDVSRPRADYYLGGHLLEHQVRGGQTATYNGILPFDMNGAIAQVSYEVGAGATTRASRNCEHSYVVLPLNARRRAENLRADEKAASQNIAEGAIGRNLARQIRSVTEAIAGARGALGRWFNA